MLSISPWLLAIFLRYIHEQACPHSLSIETSIYFIFYKVLILTPQKLHSSSHTCLQHIHHPTLDLLLVELCKDPTRNNIFHSKASSIKEKCSLYILFKCNHFYALRWKFCNKRSSNNVYKLKSHTRSTLFKGSHSISIMNLHKNPYFYMSNSNNNQILG